MAKPKRAGRKRGSRNRGYFYRNGRGWQTKDERGAFIWLTDELGERLRNEQADAKAAKLAYARWLTAERQKPATVDVECATVLEVCQAYLAKAKEEAGENKTFTDRAESLFDFCFGLPAKFKGKDLTSKGKPSKADKVHAGYGAIPVCQLKPLDVDQWLQVHAGWKSPSTKRNHIKALMRAFNYGVKAGLIPANPVRGYKVPKGRGRITYITPEQEAALCAAASPSLEMAIRVLIRTGMRPGIEFAAVESRHIKDHGERLEIRFPKEETKTKKRERVVYVTDPATIATIRQQVALRKAGPIFTSPRNDPWTQSNLSKRFRDVRDKLAKGGMMFDKDCVLYATRHTYAKRTLQGYWSGKPTNIETLARLMGNTPQICREHYLQWDELSSEFLWQSA